MIAAIASMNFVVDPFGMYRLVALDSFNASKLAVDHRVRLVKAYDVRRLRPQGIILGTSRSHVGLRPSHDGWDPGARPVYNLAFDGATTKEMYQYLLHAHAVRRLRQVVLGLDTYHATLAPATARPDFDAELLDSPGVLALPSLIRADLKVLTSLDTLRASLATVRSQSDREPQWFAPDGQRLGEVFFRRAGEHFERLGPRGYFDEIDRLEVGFKREGQLAANARVLGRAVQQTTASSETSLDYIRRIVAFCRAQGVDLRIFIAPEHAHQLEITAAIGEWASLENAKRALVQLLAEDAARHPGVPPIPLWDFSGYSSVTTEALPESGSHAEMEFYWDSSHFKDVVGDFVLDRLFGLSHARREVPLDFGVRLTPATLEPTLARLRTDQFAYRRSHPEDVEWIRSLVNGIAPPHRGDPGVVAFRRPRVGATTLISIPSHLAQP
ncbi:MAG: hypothetical protein DMD97_01595 [Candidatus Rokuibacteriota bacterium]|nr:MAG: hypothetical protein DMD97_01595 [Candidatus Rokubacteria bacterium]